MGFMSETLFAYLKMNFVGLHRIARKQMPLKDIEMFTVCFFVSSNYDSTWAIKVHLKSCFWTGILTLGSTNLRLFLQPA